MRENFWKEGDWHLMPRVSILQATMLSYNLNPSEANPLPLINSPTEIHIFVNPNYDCKGITKEQLSRRFLIILENAKKEKFLVGTLDVDFPKFAFWATHKLTGIDKELINIGASYVAENDYWRNWQSKFSSKIAVLSKDSPKKKAFEVHDWDTNLRQQLKSDKESIGVTKTAEKWNVSMTTVSNQIKKLGADLNHSTFRTKKI